MNDTLPKGGRMSKLQSATFDESERWRQAAFFVTITKWMAILAGLLAAAYAVAFIGTADMRIVPILTVCALFSLAVTLVRLFVRSVVASVYLISVFIAVGMVGVAASTSSIDILIAIATMILPALFTGLHLAPRKMLPIALFSVVAAFVSEWVNGTATWPRFDIGSTPVIYWLAHAFVGSTILYLLIALFNRLDNASREARESARQLRLLYDTSRLFGAASSLDEVLPTVAENLARILNAGGCMIVLHDPSSDELHLAASYGIDEGLRSGIRLPANEPSLARTVMKRRAPLVVESVTDSSIVNQRVATLVSAQSVVGLPLMYRDEVYGAILIGEASRQRRFVQDEIARVQGLAQQIAVEISNTRSLERERRQAADLAVLNYVGMAVAASLDPSEVSQLIVNELNRATGYEYVSLYVLDGRTLRLQAALGYESMIQELPIDRGVMARTARTGQPNLIPDVNQDPDYISAAFDVLSEACAPIRSGDEILGVLNIETRASHLLDTHDLDLLVAMAAQIAVTLRNAQLYGQTRQHLNDLSALYDLASATAAASSAQRVMHLASDGLMRSLGVEGCAFSRWDRAENCVVTVGEYRRDGDQAVLFPDDLDNAYDLAKYPMTRRLLEEGSAQQLRIDRPDAPPEEVALLRELDFACALFLPLVTHTGVFGLIELYGRDPREFSPDEIARSTAMANLATVALERARLFDAERHSRQVAEILLDVAGALGSTLDLDELLNLILDQLQSLIPYVSASIALLDEGGRRVTLRASRGLPPSLLKEPIVYDVQTTPTVNALATTRRPLRIADTFEHSGWIRLPEFEHIRAWLGLPLLRNERVVGFLMLDHTDPGFFTEEHERLADAFTSHAAIAIENARLFREERLRRQEIEAVQQAGLSLTASLELPEVLDAILSSVLNLVPATNAHVFLYSENRLNFGAAKWADGRELQSYADPRDDGLTYAVARGGEPIVVEEMRGHPLFATAPADWEGAIAGLPLKIGSTVVGVMNMAYSTGHNLTESEVRALQLLAAQAAVAIENARLLDRARQQARHERLVRLISSKISASIDIDTVLQTAVEELGRALDASRCLIRLGADPENMPVAHEFQQPGVSSVGKGSVERLPALDLAVRERRSVVNLEPYVIGDGPVLSGLITPIFIRGRIAGILTLHQCDRERRWMPDEVALLEDVSAQLGIAVDNAGLYEEMSHALGDLGLLHNIAMTVASAASLPEAVNRVVESVRSAMQHAYVTLMLVDAESSELAVSAAVGYSDDVSNVRVKMGQGVTGWVAQTGRPVLVPDVQADSRYIDGGASAIRSELAVPLISGSEVVGVLNLESSQADAFDEADLQLLTTLGGNLASVISNLRLLDEVRQANVRLQELDRLKSQFLANMSHELRTPLNSIIGFSEVLQDDLVGGLNEHQREFVGNIHSSGQHLLALINDVLDLSKIHAGRLDLHLEPASAREVIDEACAVVRSLVDKKGQQLVLDLARRLPKVFADPFRLKQVFINLLSNAHKFSPEGSLITLTAQPDGRAVCFSVIDQGTGIKPEEGDSIFQEFMQAESGLARPHEGTGLGLPITRRLVEMHGGRIWFESEGIPGKGAAFYFTIPMAAPSEAPSDAPVAATAVAGARRSVLIVDDDRQFSNLLALYLSQQGYQPVQCADGQSILELAREVRPALISLDLMLPGRDGWSVLRDLKGAPDTRDIPVLIISALDYSGASPDQHAVEYLRKPLNWDALLAALRRLGPAPRRVLIVDDDPLGNELVEAMLPPPKYAVTSVVTGPDALDAIRRELPDAILLDLMMPGMSGFDLLELLRADPVTRDVPVIVLTAKPLSEHEQAHLNAAAQTVIKKTDLTRQNLIEALQRLNLPILPAVAMREPTP